MSNQPPSGGAPRPLYGQPQNQQPLYTPSGGQPPPGYGQPPGNYGPPGYGHPPGGVPGYPGGQQPPPSGYPLGGQPPPGYGQPPGGYGRPGNPPGVAPGFPGGQPPPGYGQLPPGYGGQAGGAPGYPGGQPPGVAPPGYGHPPGFPGGQPPPGYGGPPGQGGIAPGAGFPPQGQRPPGGALPAFVTPWPSNIQSEEKEPMLLLDTTGSMNYGTTENDQTPRKDMVREAIGIIVAQLAKQDSQAGHEASGGGLRTITFAGGSTVDLDDLNPSNLSAKWASIRWAGGTRIMPGWRKLVEVFTEEFGNRPPQLRPLMMVLIITDGDADDVDEFSRALHALGDRVYVTLAIVGYGPDHDAAIACYQRIMTNNAHVKVLPFGSTTNPDTIARALLKMVE